SDTYLTGLAFFRVTLSSRLRCLDLLIQIRVMLFHQSNLMLDFWLQAEMFVQSLLAVLHLGELCYTHQ
ncbi:Hypothetical protein SMAX5B_021108, partial [Scophthalmus maximus]